MTVAALLAIYADAQTAFLASLAALGRDDHAEHRQLMQCHEELSDAYVWGWLDVQGMPLSRTVEAVGEREVRVTW